MKLKKSVLNDGTFHAWMAFCPACDEIHVFDRRWTFDGNMDAPTFSPSMLDHGWTNESGSSPRCHSFLRAGVWEYLPDSGHAFAGKNVPLPDWPFS